MTYRSRVVYTPKRSLRARIRMLVDAFHIYRARGLGRWRAFSAADAASRAFMRQWLKAPMSDTELRDCARRALADAAPGLMLPAYTLEVEAVEREP